MTILLYRYYTLFAAICNILLLSSEYLDDRVHRLLLHAGQHVRVGIQRHGDLSVATDRRSQPDPHRDPYEAVVNSMR